MGKVYCDICKKRCKGHVFKAIDKYFHKDCFKCSECRCDLQTGGFFMKDNKYICQKDHQKKSTPKCRKCGKILSDDILSALSYSFHKECFICSQCKNPFNLGNRVTVWENEFYCVGCSQSLNSVPATTVAGDKGYTSPLYKNHQPQSQHQHRLSFADHPSPVSFADTIEEGRVTPSAQKTNGKTLKSSLRHSHTMQPASNGGNSDLADSGHSPNAISTLPVASFQGQLNHSFISSSHTLSYRQSQSLHGSGRHALSEYGRFCNLSYASIADQSSRGGSKDTYRRSLLHTPATSNSISHLQHFHVPQGKRFPLEPNRIVPAGMSYTSRSLNSGLRNALMMQCASSGRLVAASASSASTNVGPGGVDQEDACKRSTLIESESVSLEARRLASFPSGHPPDATWVPAIERYDWPAPASTSVMMAEIMRERRQRLREQGVLQTSSEESVEDLSIDTSVSSHSDLDRISGGLGKAIVVGEERAQRRKPRTTHLVDPISASRSPNAKTEPPYKTRYVTHTFASPSRESQRSSVSPHRLGYSLELVNLGHRVWTASDYYRCQHNEASLSRNSTGLRPGYTAGQLSLSSSKTSSMPGSHRFSPLGLGIEQTNGHTNGNINGHGPIQSQLSPVRTNRAHVNGEALNYSQNFDTTLLSSAAPGHPSMASSTPIGTQMKHGEGPMTEVSYKDLVANTDRLPKGIDRTRLEMYLSDAEFKDIFQLSRVAFYRLPEWKRNDLKRRVDLF